MTLAFDFGDARHAGVLRRAIGFIRANLGEKITLEMIAKEAFMSPAYFSRIFRREVGKTVQQFIVDERLSKAESLMRARELTLLEIAGLVGIRNQSLFNRLFVKRYGFAPGIYRKNLLYGERA